MKIFSIETSADETSAAIVENGNIILSNVVASSADMHDKTGGIIPEMAAREQIKCIIPVIEEALFGVIPAKAGIQLFRGNGSRIKSGMTGIDAIAVTIGPGLIGSLLVGVETAKTLSLLTEKPIIPVNHVLAHIYANFLSDQDTPGVASILGLPRGGRINTIHFPAIALVVSGGHTELYLMNALNKLKWLGGTLDDAAGEAFDKTARLLGLGYPGGPTIAAAAAKFKVQSSKFKVKLPRPMMNQDNLNFSFSGLKTAVYREIDRLKKSKQWKKETINQLSYEIQESITDVLVHKTLLAARQYKVKSILLGGGVAANQRLKEKFSSLITNYPASPAGRQLPITLYIPPSNLCTDNASYIASYAFYNFKPIPWQKIQAQPNLEVEV